MMVTAARGTARTVPIGEFDARFAGSLLRPGDDGYEVARRVWNDSIDRHPALIARCTGSADVIAAVRFARDHDLLVALRSGGHSIPGHSVCDDGMVIDLSPMRGVRVDPSLRSVHAQAGVTWGGFDRETGVFGVAVTGGQISTTGITGLTLGGGIGWLMRKHGLTCDNVRSFALVSAVGETLSASADENPELFWALRGGGGNFGVVTSIEYRLHEVGTVLGGAVFHRGEKAKEILRFYRDFAATAPDELTTLVACRIAPRRAPFPEELQGVLLVAIAVCYAGDLAEGEKVIEPLRRFGRPELDLIQPMPYPLRQSIMDVEAAPGHPRYEKAGYLGELSDRAIDTFVDHVLELPETSPRSQMFLQQLGGAVARVREEETAFGDRDADFVHIVMATWAHDDDAAPHIAWSRRYSSAMQPFSRAGVYVNFDSDEGEQRVRATYGAAKYRRLVAVKDRWDPGNVFSLNQNIVPSVAS